MSRTIRDVRFSINPFAGRKAPGSLSKVKRLVARQNRRVQERQQRASEDPVIDRADKIRNFWLEYL